MTISKDGTDMGSKDEAELGLLRAWLEWTKFQGPHIDSRSGHKKREAFEREARSRLVSAAAMLAWHINEERPF